MVRQTLIYIDSNNRMNADSSTPDNYDIYLQTIHNNVQSITFQSIQIFSYLYNTTGPAFIILNGVQHEFTYTSYTWSDLEKFVIDTCTSANIRFRSEKNILVITNGTLEISSTFNFLGVIENGIYNFYEFVYLIHPNGTNLSSNGLSNIVSKVYLGTNVLSGNVILPNTPFKDLHKLRIQFVDRNGKRIPNLGNHEMVLSLTTQF